VEFLKQPGKPTRTHCYLNRLLVAHALEFVRPAYFLSVDEHAELLAELLIERSMIRQRVRAGLNTSESRCASAWVPRPRLVAIRTSAVSKCCAGC
jgi:hypothetical protein